MSVNRNSNIIKAIKGQERDPIRYNFSASLWAIGGGSGGGKNTETGGGGGASYGGGGGGAGAVVSASISIVPNITWNINVGGGGSTDTDGEDTTAVVYNNDYNGLVTFRAQGGIAPVQVIGNDSSGTGGASGTGSVEFSDVTQSFSNFTGSAQNGLATYYAAGGGAGANGHGNAGFLLDGPVAVGGNGGSGVDLGGAIGRVAGGGSAGAHAAIVQENSSIFNGGKGGYTTSETGKNATNFGGGGGGGTITSQTSATINGGSGFDGTFALRIPGKIGTNLGEFDITASNATTTYLPASNETDIIFNSGSGTFRYNAPFPYDKQP